MLSPRIRGISQPQRLPAQEFNPVDTSEIQQSVQNLALQRYNQDAGRSTQSNQNNSEILNNISGQLGETIQLRRAADSYERVKEDTTSPALLDFAGKAFDVWNSVQERRAAQQEAVDEQQLQANRLQLEIKKQELLSNAESRLRDPAVGFAGYNREITSFIEQNSQYVTAEDMVGVTTELYAPLRQLQSEQAEAYYGGFSEILDTSANTTIANLTTAFSGQLYRLRYLTDPAQAQTAANTFLTELQTQVSTANLTPLQRIQVTEALSVQLAEQYGTATQAMSEVQTGLQGFNEYYTRYQTEVVPLLEQGEYANGAALDYQLRAQYRITGETPFTDPLYNQTQVQNRLDAQNRMRGAVEDGVIDGRRAYEFERADVLSLAYSFYSDPTSIVQWQTPGWEENRHIRQAIELAEQFSTYADWQQSGLPQLMASAQQRITGINQAVSRLRLNYLEGTQSGGSDDLLREIVLLQRMGSGTQEYLQGTGEGERYNQTQAGIAELQAQMQAGQATPEDIRAATQELIGYYEQEAQLINQQFQAQQNGIAETTRALQSWGIASADDFRTQAEASGATYDGILQEITEFEANAQRNLVTLPNFNLPQLDTYTFGSTEAVIPFRAGGLAQAGGQHRPSDHAHGAPRGGRNHAGIDFAVPVGTPIVSYVQGTVTNVQDFGGDGPNERPNFGMTVEITAPDGTRHLFADLSDARVTEGQQIAPGQDIGISGNTGNGSAHLHWGIYRAGTSGYGYDASINPYEYTAGLTQHMSAARPTQVQQTASGMANAYAPSQRQDYMTNGALGNDGAGNFGYAELAEDRTFRIELHRTASRVGIPAQWLADMIAMETGGTFSAGITNQGGSGATGLIQFHDSSGYKTIGGVRYRISDIGRMDRVSQLDLVGDYLEERLPFSPRGYESIYDVLLAIWAGTEAQRNFQTRGYSQDFGRRVADVDINFDGYAARLGRHAGRRYQPPGRSAPVHTRPVNSCPVCARMTAATFQRHEGQ